MSKPQLIPPLRSASWLTKLVRRLHGDWWRPVSAGYTKGWSAHNPYNGTTIAGGLTRAEAVTICSNLNSHP